MTDLEMMKLAAKAAGLEYTLDCDDLIIDGAWLGTTREWNPLEDDGDALRLACTLNLDVDIQESHTRCWSADGVITMTSGEYGDDKHRAVRRAIVLVAAAISVRL